MSMDQEHFVIYESSIGYIIIVMRNGKIINLDVFLALLDIQGIEVHLGKK